jgi:tetratricopeptide (TPR) repeat protein
MTRDFAQAEQHARAALAQGQATAADHATLGWAALVRGDDSAAHRAFHAALALAPRHPDALVGLANILRRQGLLRDAVLHCDAALAENPQSLDAWLERGFVLASGGSMAAAADCYRQVLALDSLHVAANAGLAAILARAGDSPAGRDHATTALAIDPDNAVAAAALATMDLEVGQPQRARALLEPLLANAPGPSADRALLANLLGDALAKLNESDAAYAAYWQSKTDFASIHADRYTSAAPALDFVQRIQPEVEQGSAPPSAPGPQPPAAATTHLFLLGFPRSGTTMAENILASIPGVSALEERPTLGQADHDFLAQPGGLERFNGLADTALQPYRAAYWDGVARAGLDVAGACLVDMDPLKGTRLPLIARLFPQAKVLIMRRDPRDVVWSCFHTHFALTNAALDFTTLAGTARLYAAMMELIELCRERLPLTVHEVRYEALVRDFDAETQALCAFAGLPWSEALRQFGATAQRRGVATASAGQVRKGLYDGSGQWRPYAHHFEPVLPILQPWIERFGYAI